jgi:adenylate cyclase
MSEKMSPEQVVQLLNSYFEIMVDVIFKHKGMLDKFMGDGLMAIFGAPLEDVYQEENAIRAALEMQLELNKLNIQVRDKYKIDLSVGIGINSGLAIIGNVGSSKRMEYTAIGDTVNLASRLESKAKDLQTEILISEYTYNSVRSVADYRFENKGSLSIKGKQEQVTAYAVFSRE